MLKADFEKYSLALIQDDKIIFSSDRHGLKPLMDCLENYSQVKEKLTLHDKVIGLAAAKLIVYSGIISCVHTPLASKPAKKFLEEYGIKLYAKKIVANILKKDKSSICPGEIIALNTVEPDSFCKQIMAMLSSL
jgi:hypothetical protein